MKILYGVQGTGNGHITRARIMAKALAKVGADIDWVFSGRRRDEFFDMEGFGQYQLYRGMTFSVSRGRVRYGKTFWNNSLSELIRDIRSLNVHDYDFIVNDFEPVSAWAARLAGKKVIGLSHQNAFLYEIPKRNNHFFTDLFMRHFAPVTQPIGLHWHHFNQPILPPLIEHSELKGFPSANQYLVYLPFMHLDDIRSKLQRFTDYDFYIYHRVPEAIDEGHLHIRPFSREGFQQVLTDSQGVICSAGFELLSESIHLGKKLLVCPLGGQMEQASNALALSQLGYGAVAPRLDEAVIADWLPLPSPRPIVFPNVAETLATWLADGASRDLTQLSHELWQQVTEPRVASSFMTLKNHKTS